MSAFLSQGSYSGIQQGEASVLTVEFKKGKKSYRQGVRRGKVHNNSFAVGSPE